MSSVDEVGTSDQPAASSPHQSVSIPGEALIIVAVRNTVLFPGMVAPITLGRPKAIAAAGKALELDPTLAEAHTSLGYARFWYEWNWPAAERCFKRALELNPAYATARQWHSSYLQTLDRVDESLAEINRVLEFDPLSLVFRTARVA